jgi:CelD/BcsL family acetyltransferase involved in cellulose biosynthesis
VLERVRADGPLRNALAHAEPLCWAEGAPYADLSGGMPAFMNSLKARVTRQQRKRVRRFEEEGQVAFEVANSPTEAASWLEEAMALKRDWLARTGRLSRAFVRQATADCLDDLARAMSGSDATPRMIVSRLTLNGRVAAIEMGFRHGPAYHLYLGAFEPEFARLGPGNVLTEKVLDWCAANGVERYDMMAPRSRNKSEWQSGDVAVLDFALPLTLRGRLYAATMLKHISPAVRRAFYALPVQFRMGLCQLALRRAAVATPDIRRAGAGRT